MPGGSRADGAAGREKVALILVAVDKRPQAKADEEERKRPKNWRRERDSVCGFGGNWQTHRLEGLKMDRH